MVRKLASPNLHKGIRGMDHIHSLLIMEDDLGEEGRDTETTSVGGTTAMALLPQPAEVDAGPSEGVPNLLWRVCYRCSPNATSS